jgi:hypothetical protein
MEGCDNSGKVYRNTIFDNNKFVYKKYVLNYTDCCPNKVSPTAMGCNDIDIKIEEFCLQGDCLGHDYKLCKIEEQSIIDNIAYLQEQITFINNQLHLPPDGDITSPCSLSDVEIQRLTDLKEVYINQLNAANISLGEQTRACDTLLQELLAQQQAFANQKADCKTISVQIYSAQTELNLMQFGTSQYDLQLDYINQLTEKYDKCIRLASTVITNYSTVYITQLYNTNEYEGNVTVYGDDDWDGPTQDDGSNLKPAGPFYNTELIRDIDCEEEVIDIEVNCGRDCQKTVVSCPQKTHNYNQESPWRISGILDCECTGTTATTVAHLSVYSGPIAAPNAGDIQSSDFQFTIPLGATILGVSVWIRRKQLTTLQWVFSDSAVQLMYGGVPVGNTMPIYPISTSTVWGTEWETVQYGHSNDLSGYNWSPQKINAPTFGVRLLPEIGWSPVGSPENIGYLDCIKVFVRYYYDPNNP